MAFGQDAFSEARYHWEQAFAGYRDAGELRSAVRVAAELADLHRSVLGNPAAAAGWIGRSEVLLEQIGPCVERGYLALAIVACDLPDADEVERSAAIALGLAREYGDRDLEVRALADGGLALVTQGRIAEGFSRLDQAMASISAGEVHELSVAGKSLCALLTACERTGDVRRAEEWTRLVEEAMTRSGVDPLILRMHCRVAFGTALCSVGRWSDAEAELAKALGPDSSQSIHHRCLTLSLLADIRLLQGRFEEAAALLRPYEDRLAACGPLARLHLLQGEPAMAAAIAQRALSELHGDRLRSVGLLALLVEAELARDDLIGAQRAADRIPDLVDGTVPVPVLVAEAAIASGRIASVRGATGEAIGHFEAAMRALGDDDRPALCAVIRLEMAQVRAAAGDREGAVTDARAALAIFERLGADLLTDRTGALLRHLGWTGRGASRATTASPTQMASLSPREREVLALVRVGLTNAEIGARLYITAKTAEHHVGRVLTKLGVRSRAEAAAVATAALPPAPDK
ncbi:MAG: hypothetical protein NVS3B21_24140 [Acidimicrobiales bacterium]